MKNRIFLLLIVLFLLCGVSGTVFARDTIDMDREGSIKLDVRFMGDAVVGGRFSCVKVADVEEGSSGYFYRRLIDGNTYHDGLSSELADEMYRFVAENKAFFKTIKTSLYNETGTVVFSGVKPGLYLILQDIQAPGYCVMKPFLVIVPYLEDGVYQYDVNASVKSELSQEEIVDPSEPTVDPTPDFPTEPTTDSPTEPSNNPTDDTTGPDDPTKPTEKLPQTGQLNWPIPLLVVMGVGLFAMGWILCFKNRTSE